MVGGLLQAVFLLGIVGLYTKEMFKLISSYYSEQFKEQIIEKMQETFSNSSEVVEEGFCTSSGFLELVGISF